MEREPFHCVVGRLDLDNGDIPSTRGQDFFRKRIVVAARKPVELVILSVLVSLEAITLAVATIWLISRFFVEEAENVAGAALIILITAIVTAWITITAVNTWRAKPWVRGAILTWQVLQIAVAVGAFQGIYAQPAVGWAILVPSLVAAGLLFTPRVLELTTRR
jgi:hypothetical protein